MNNLDTHGLAWAAGFFDGEGCIGCYKHHKGTMELHLKITQKDRRVLDKFRKAVGRVGISIVDQTTKYHQLQAHNSNVIRIFNLLKPYLSEAKIEQGEKAIAKYEEYCAWRASLTNPQKSAKLAAE
jgi:LAGLIDADG endonuclease